MSFYSTRGPDIILTKHQAEKKAEVAPLDVDK